MFLQNNLLLKITICAFFSSRIVRILVWFLYFRIALIVQLSSLSIDESYSMYFGIIRFLITFLKKIIRVSAVSNSFSQTLPFTVKCILSLMQYRKMKVVLFSKRVYYPLSLFCLSFNNTSFWSFVAEIHNNFFVLHTWHNFLHFCFLGICYEVWIYS